MRIKDESEILSSELCHVLSKLQAEIGLGSR